MVNKNWMDMLIDSASLRAIYGQDVPSLKDIDLHEITLHRDGPSITFRFDLASIPKQLPKKWEIAKFNRVQMKLIAFDVCDLSIIGWQTRGKLDLIVDGNDDLIHISSQGDVKLNIVASKLMINSISAYRDSEDGVKNHVQ